MVFWALDNALGGEIFVPKIPSYCIKDVAEAIGPTCLKPIVGIRPGEKLHEEMITISDSFSTFDLGPYYAILPTDNSFLARYQQSGIDISQVREGFSYDSGTNPNFLSVQKIRDLIRIHVDSSFQPV